MKIKITQSGWLGFTGQMGHIDFVDGVSVDDVSRSDAAYLAGIVGVEDAETGKNPSNTQRMIDDHCKSANVEQTFEKSEAVAKNVQKYTKKELEEIADKSGIRGIREIADPLGLKGNSIAELIEKIQLNQQK